MSDIRAKEDNVFGWKSVFKYYTFKNLCTDICIPSIISFLITIAIYLTPSVPLVLLEKSIALTINILPTIISLLLAAYAIVLTLFWSEYGRAIRKNDHGAILLKEINSSFAATIVIMILSLIISLLIYFIIGMNLTTSCLFIEYSINGLSIFIVVLFLLFSIWTLKDIVINIYNLGVLSSHFEDDINQNYDKSEYR